jgi:spore germination protein KA
MKIKGLFKKLFRFHTKGPEFSLGDHSWERPPAPRDEPGECLKKDLAKNRLFLEQTFELPDNKDFIFREFQIPKLKKKALIIFIDGLTDRNTQNFAVLQPLMILDPEGASGHDPVLTVLEKMLPGHQISKTKRWQEVIDGILDGSSALLLDGADEALIIETKGWDHRGVQRPENEHVVRGPQEGFTETFRSNTATVRRYLKDPKLVTEIFRVGRRSKTLLAVMYIKDIANPKLIEEVKYRIQSIAGTTDYISETGMLEELLEDNPRSFFPQIFSTERPDRVAAFIREGNVGIIMANSPYSLVIPTTFSIFLHAAEDYYLRWPFGNFLRVIRTISIFIALMLPALYIAVVNYHQEMIPTDLLLAITTSREAVPFPAIVEILFMELAFELIREAGVRIPSIIGPTIGIVGALILGQAAVAASVVSPILIIVIAITAISSFVVPNYNASFTVRILRFVFILLAGFLGFLGIAFGIFIMTLHMARITNFGVPFLTPIAPYRPKNKDRIIRPESYKQPYRPLFLRPLDWIRQTQTPRPWDRPDQDSDTQGDEAP